MDYRASGRITTPKEPYNFFGHPTEFWLRQIRDWWIESGSKVDEATHRWLVELTAAFPTAKAPLLWVSQSMSAH